MRHGPRRNAFSIRLYLRLLFFSNFFQIPLDIYPKMGYNVVTVKERTTQSVARVETMSKNKTYVVTKQNNKVVKIYNNFEDFLFSKNYAKCASKKYNLIVIKNN